MGSQIRRKRILFFSCFANYNVFSCVHKNPNHIWFCWRYWRFEDSFLFSSFCFGDSDCLHIYVTCLLGTKAKCMQVSLFFSMHFQIWEVVHICQFLFAKHFLCNGTMFLCVVIFSWNGNVQYIVVDAPTCSFDASFETIGLIRDLVRFPCYVVNVQCTMCIEVWAAEFRKLIGLVSNSRPAWLRCRWRHFRPWVLLEGKYCRWLWLDVCLSLKIKILNA